MKNFIRNFRFIVKERILYEGYLNKNFQNVVLDKVETTRRDDSSVQKNDIIYVNMDTFVCLYLV